MKTFISTLLTIFIVAFTSVSAEPAINSDTAKVVNKNTGSFSFFLSVEKTFTDTPLASRIFISLDSKVSLELPVVAEDCLPFFDFSGGFLDTDMDCNSDFSSFRDMFVRQFTDESHNTLGIQIINIQSGSATICLSINCKHDDKNDGADMDFTYFKTFNINDNENTSLGVLYLKPILKDGTVRGITIEEEK